MITRPSPLMAVLVALAALAFAASPFLVPDFGGFEPDQFPVPQEDPPIQPAGYAFAIWGVIYVWLVLSAGSGLVARARAVDWQDMRPPLLLSLAVGAAWLPVALVSPLGATVLIWVMLLSAVAALRRAPVLDRWFARGAVGLYAGWLTAASSVAIGLVLAGFGLMDQDSAAMVALLLALALACLIQYGTRDCPEYGLGVGWALVGIIIANFGRTDFFMALAIIGVIVIGSLALRSASR